MNDNRNNNNGRQNNNIMQWWVIFLVHNSWHLRCALLYNTHLLHLNLSNNDSVGNDGVIALAY